MKKRLAHIRLVAILVTAAFGQWFAPAVRAANPVASPPALTIATAASGSLTLSVADPTEAASPVTISGYTFSFTVVPEVGSTGTITLNGASVPASALLPGTLFGARANGSLYVVTDGELSATAVVPIIAQPLFNLSYAVGSGASGRFDIDVNQVGVNASVLYDANGNNVPNTTFVNGILIAPEPSCALFATVLVWRFRPRRSR